jgi:CRP-like cAMP-binding protein
MREDTAAELLERELFVRTKLERLAELGLGRLAQSLAEEVIFAPGAVIHRAGDPPHDFCAFLRGDVEIVADGMPPRILADQSGVGLLDVLADRPRSATVTAVTTVRALRLRAPDYLDFLEEHFELAMNGALLASKDVHELSLALAPDGGFAPIAVPPGPAGPAPRAPMSLVQKLEVLRDARVFRGANVQALVRLAQLGREVHAGTGDILFRRGEAAGHFYLVAKGVIEAEHEAPALVARFGPGDLVCGYGALGAADNQYVAVARSPAVVFAFSEEDFFDVMEEHFELTRSVLAGIAADYTRLVLERERRNTCAAGAR